MGKAIYTIQGSSTVKPVDLPDGFTVSVEVARFDKEVSGFTISDSAHQTDSLFIRHNDVTSRHVTREQVTALRDALTEWLDESVPTLRVIHDSGDSANSIWRWYEIEPEKFIYYRSEDDARSETKSGANSGRDGLTYEQIKNDYSIRTVTTWKV